MQQTIISLTDQHISFLPQIHAIEKLSFSRPWSLYHLNAEMINPLSLSYALVTDNTYILGYLFSSAIIDEYQINKLCIANDSRNRGFGTILLNHYIGIVRERNGNAIFLEVNERNYSAVHIYEKAGFTLTRIRYQAYDDTDNALEMKFQIVR